jgi:hypothetical protein
LVTDFEPNYFPFLECDLPDFPWLFTSAVPDAAGHLQPWICLVVVRKELASITTAPNQPLPVLECPGQEFPNLAQSWAWAHAQIVEGSTPVMDGSLDERTQKKALSEMLRQHPERSASRLLSPRRLDPNSAYYACLVPTFEVGRKAGLGEPVTADDERTLKPAWLPDEGNDPIRLPVYFQWEFSTGLEGDFEALARRLVPRILPATVGLRSMSIAAPGWGMPETPPEAPSAVLGLEGALRTPDTESTPWPDEARIPFQTALRKILNAPAEQAPPGSEPSIVGPPLYGQWHAKQRAIPDGVNPPHWFRQLNLDPRHRVTAGLGSLVIRMEQEQLMASAWDQLAQHEQDNQRLKRAQLSEAVGEVLSEKHFQPLPLNRFLQVTAPVRSALNGGRPLERVPQAGPTQPLFSAAFRRMARQRGPLARRLAPSRHKPALAGDQTGVGRHLEAGLAGVGMLVGSPGIVAKPRAVRLRSLSATVVARGAEVPTDMATTRVHLAKTNLLKALKSSLTVLAAVREDIPEAESTDLIRFAPHFPQPMYEPLRDYFEDSLLPGLEQVLPNTITLLETNPRFIEAYMAGLNHEMSRELLWRGFPTDQRGTYFRQFWDIRGHVPLPTTDEEREALQDIPLITDWPDSAQLGENAGRGSSEGQIVLLLRGDLLRRYSRAIIYAAEAVWSADGTRRELGSEERYPLFRATRQPDITMLGFPLTEEEVRGADNPTEGHPGWFFVLQQQPTEPRFGLDVPTTYGGVPEHWSDLSWGHLAADENGLKALVYVPIDGLLEGKTIDSVPWGENSAHMAFITRQRPFRVAIHARTWLT